MAMCRSTQVSSIASTHCMKALKTLSPHEWLATTTCDAQPAKMSAAHRQPLPQINPL